MVYNTSLVPYVSPLGVYMFDQSVFNSVERFVVFAYDFGPTSSAFQRELKLMRRYGKRRDNPHGEAAWRRAHSRLHALIEEEAAKIHGLVFVSDSYWAGTHRTCVVLFPEIIPREDLAHMARYFDNREVIRKAVVAATPGEEWWKVYYPDPMNPSRLCRF